MKADRILPIILPFVALLAAVLACQADNMRARDLPVWTCPTAAPSATVTPAPTSTVLPGTPTPTPAATTTPWPTATPYALTNDFPLERSVKIGGVGGVGLGIWVWMADTQVDGPFIREGASMQTTWWVASWEVTVENASLTQDYEFYPFAQLYALEVVDPDGTTTRRGAWGISAEAHEAIGLPELELTEATTLLKPGDRRTVRVAAFIPGPELVRMGYVLDPLDTVAVEEMIEKNSLGSNVGVWINATEQDCTTGEVTIVPGGTATSPGLLLARHPVEGSPVISRGFGCHAFFTGELGTDCPAGEPWFHNGTDYVAPAGSPYIDALREAGAVDYAGDNPSGPDCSAMDGSQPPHEGYGNFVKHSATVNGFYVEVWGAHLSSFATATGEPTAPGSTLGGIGSTGCSTGAHLHFSVRVDGLYVDPVTLIP